MMKTRLTSMFVLVAAILAACSSAPATQLPAAPPVAVVELPSATPVISVGGEATQPPVAVEAPTQVPLPVATSRGPDLHTTDPSTVSLASGGYQFVEFFRFT
jgi:hypothetical protein